MQTALFMLWTPLVDSIFTNCNIQFILKVIIGMLDARENI